MEGIRFKFTDENGPGKIIQPESLESIDALATAFENSLSAQATPKLKNLGAATRSDYPEREKNIRVQMSADAYRNIFDADVLVPREDLEARRLFGLAKGKTGILTKKFKEFEQSIKSESDLTNEEVEERMKAFYMQELDNLNVSENLKDVIRKACSPEVEQEATVEIPEPIESKRKSIEKTSLLSSKIKLVNGIFDAWKERISNFKENSGSRLELVTFYRQKIGEVDTRKLNKEEAQIVNEEIAKLQKEISKVLKEKHEEIKKRINEKHLTALMNRMQRDLDARKRKIEKINFGNNEKIGPFDFYLKKFTNIKTEGVSGEYLERLNAGIKDAEKEIVDVWKIKRQEFERYNHEEKIRKVKEEFRNAIGKIDVISKDDYESQYGTEGKGQKQLDYDIKKRIEEYLDFYLHHNVEPIDAVPLPVNWNETWKDINEWVKTINDPNNKYGLAIVDGVTYVVEKDGQEIEEESIIQDNDFIVDSEAPLPGDSDISFAQPLSEQDFSHMTDGSEGFSIHNEEEQEQNLSHFEGFSGGEGIKSDDEEKKQEHEKDENYFTGDEKADAGSESKENEFTDENHEEVFAKLPDGIVDVFRRFAAIRKSGIESEASDEDAIVGYLKKVLSEQMEGQKKFLLDEYKFNEKDGKIFIDKIITETLKEK